MHLTYRIKVKRFYYTKTVFENSLKMISVIKLILKYYLKKNQIKVTEHYIILFNLPPTSEFRLGSFRYITILKALASEQSEAIFASCFK